MNDDNFGSASTAAADWERGGGGMANIFIIAEMR